MATPKSPKNEFHDPLGKWKDDYGSIKQSAVDPLLRAQGEVNRLQSALNSPGLNRQERALLIRSLAEAKRALQAAKKDSHQTLREVYQTQRIQRDVAIKLSTLRSFLMNNPALSSEAKERAKHTEKLLEQVLLSTNTVKTGIEEAGGVFDRLEQITQSVESLPDELKDEFASRDIMLQEILQRQARAQEFLNKQREDIRAIGRRTGAWLASKAMNVADRVGIGPFSLGNALRLTGAVARGVRGGYRAAKYIGQTIQAHRIVNMSRDGGSPTAPESHGSSLADTFKQYVQTVSQFHRRALAALSRKSGATQSEATSMLSGVLPFLSGKLKDMLGGLLKGAGVIGAGGAVLGGLSKLGGGALKALSRLAGPIGAALLGWEAGNAINPIVQPYIEKFVRYFTDTRSDDPRTPFEKDIQTEIDHAKSLWEDSVKVVNAAKATVMEKANNWIDNAKRFLGYSMDYGMGRMSATGMKTVLGGAGGGRGFVNPPLVGSAEFNKTNSPIDAGRVLSLGAGVNIKDLHPGMRANLLAMAQEYYSITGKPLPINSGYRSSEQQAQLYSMSGPGSAAAPGQSMHNYGLAFDTNTANANELEKYGLLSKYGFARPVSKEKWHVQPAGMSLAAAKAGLYSADAPKDQNSAKASPSPQEITAPVARGTVAGQTQANSGSPTSTKGTMSSGTRNSVSSIPTFDSSDGLFMAMNIGVL